MVSTGTEEGGYAFLNSRMHGRGSDILEKFRKPLVSFEVARRRGRREALACIFSCDARAKGREKIGEKKGECMRYKNVKE